jgi:hypothetical protein
MPRETAATISAIDDAMMLSRRYRSGNRDARVPIRCPNPREFAVKAGESQDDPRT